jgi:type VI secretion system protein ImpC
MPRILLRLPYGDDTDPIEAFDFEELNPGRPHESFLWCNPAFGCALLLGQSFMESRWDMAAGEHLEIADLPAFSFEQDGEKQLQACGEVYLSQRAGESILEEGIMPFLSYANRNAVRLMRFQSIAEPAQGLAGPWR